jgi:hypothetical protein
MTTKLSFNFLWALLCLLLPFATAAQTNCNGYTGNTDWRNYTPPGPVAPLPPLQNINNFNWSTNFFTFYKNVSGTVTPYQVQSPFWENTSGLATQPNIDHFRNKFYNNGFYTNPTQAIESVDIWPEDGWELLYKDFGDAAAAYANNPSFGLYNRYTGIIRVFYYVEQMGNTASSTGRISVEPKFNYKNNALLSFTQTEIKALDAFERHLSSGLNYAQALTNFWLFIEIPIAFDPCVCRYSAQEIMEFKFEIIEQGTLVLEGNANGFSAPMIYNNGVFTPIKSNIISSHSKKKGATDYLAEANGYYKTLSSFKDNLNTMIGFQNSSGTDKTKAAGEVNLFDTWVTIAKRIPKIGAAIGIIDLLITGGKAKNTSTKEPTPIGYETELKLKLTGSIREEINLSTLSLRVPGVSNVGSSNPIYNNPLGVFNLLESPPLEFVEYSATNKSGVIQRFIAGGQTYYYVQNFNTSSVFSNYKIYEYKLKKSTQYNRLVNFIINPSSGLAAKKIRGAILFKFSNLPDVIDTTNYVNYMAGPVEFGITIPDRDGLGFVHRMRMLGYEIESWPDGTKKLKDITFRTSYSDLACLEDEANFYCWVNTNSVNDFKPETWLKLDIQLERTDAYAISHSLDVQDVMMILKYDANNVQNTTANLTYEVNMMIGGNSDPNDVLNRRGYEILPNGEFQPNSISQTASISYPWNGTWGISNKHSMSPSPWPTNPVNKRSGTLIVDNSNIMLFVPPPAQPPGTTINVYNLYVHPSVVSFNTDFIINVGNHVYSGHNWTLVNTNIDWQQNTIVAYKTGPGQTVPFFGSTFQPIVVNNPADFSEFFTILDLMGFEISSPFQLFPFVTGFNVSVNPEGTILMQPSIGGQGAIHIYGFNQCYGSPQNFQATQSNVQSFCNSTTYESRSLQKTDFIDEPENEEILEAININLYPNPNNGAFVVAFDVVGTQDVSLSVSDMSGKELFNAIDSKQYNTGSYKQNIVVDNIAGGIYLCILRIGEDVYKEKLVIMK